MQTGATSVNLVLDVTANRGVPAFLLSSYDMLKTERLPCVFISRLVSEDFFSTRLYSGKNSGNFARVKWCAGMKSDGQR